MSSNLLKLFSALVAGEAAAEKVVEAFEAEGNRLLAEAATQDLLRVRKGYQALLTLSDQEILKITDDRAMAQLNKAGKNENGNSNN